MEKKYRLTHNASFNYIYKNGQSSSDKYMVLIYSRTRYSLKVGFSVSKKIGNSVLRNRTKRRLKECFRSLIPELDKKYNYVIVAREAAVDAKYQELLSGMKRLMIRNKLLIAAKDDGASKRTPQCGYRDDNVIKASEQTSQPNHANDKIGEYKGVKEE